MLFIIHILQISQILTEGIQNASLLDMCVASAQRSPNNSIYTATNTLARPKHCQPTCSV